MRWTQRWKLGCRLIDRLVGRWVSDSGVLIFVWVVSLESRGLAGMMRCCWEALWLREKVCGDYHDQGEVDRLIDRSIDRSINSKQRMASSCNKIALELTVTSQRMIVLENLVLISNFLCLRSLRSSARHQVFSPSSSLFHPHSSSLTHSPLTVSHSKLLSTWAFRWAPPPPRKPIHLNPHCSSMRVTMLPRHPIASLQISSKKFGCGAGEAIASNARTHTC